MQNIAIIVVKYFNLMKSLNVFKNKTLICVVGPTAIGKTSLAIEIAKKYSTEIISADSRQFYKEMSIGTAVPSNEELNTVKHHFIQNRSIFEDYSVGDFEKDSLKLLESLFETYNSVVMVGGSGLYIDAVVNGLDTFPDVPSEVRKKIISEFESKGIELLQKELKELDPHYYKKVDLQNHHRLIRALEICRSTGLPYSSFLRSSNTDRNFNTIYIGLTARRETIYNRINKRVEYMIEDGLIHEAKLLHKYKDLNALQTVGYKELFNYFEGKFSEEQAIEEIKKNTRRFAKKQGTWFRRNNDISWFDFKTRSKEVIEYINNAQSK